MITDGADEENESWNGAIEAATTFTGAVVVFAVKFLDVNWEKWGSVAIVSMTGLTSILLFLMGTTSEIWMAYIGIRLYFIERKPRSLSKI